MLIHTGLLEQLQAAGRFHEDHEYEIEWKSPKSIRDVDIFPLWRMGQDVVQKVHENWNIVYRQIGFMGSLFYTDELLCLFEHGETQVVQALVAFQQVFHRRYRLVPGVTVLQLLFHVREHGLYSAGGSIVPGKAIVNALDRHRVA